MNLHGYEYEYRIFSWIISADISVPLKIYGYEYEYAKFSWILSMGVPNLSLDCSWQSFSRYIPNQTLVSEPKAAKAVRARKKHALSSPDSNAPPKPNRPVATLAKARSNATRTNPARQARTQASQKGYQMAYEMVNAPWVLGPNMSTN